MEKENLKKSVNFFNALFLVIGTIIGSGIFLKLGIVFKNAGSGIMGLWAWIIGGVITLCSALTIAEVGTAIPKTGGLYIYLEELYGKKVGFLLGWVQTIIGAPAIYAALSIAFMTFASFFIPMSGTMLKVFAAIVLILLTCLNIISTRYGGYIQSISTIGKLLPIIILVFFGIIKGEAQVVMSMKDASFSSGFGTAILGTFWAYDGWIYVTNMSGELKNPKRDLPRSIILGVLSVIFAYVVFNFAILKILSFDKIIISKEPAVDAATILFGNQGAVFIILGIMVSVFGTLNGYLMSGARTPFAMASKGELPFSEILSKVHPKFNTPINALILQTVISLIYIFSGSFNTLTDMVVFVLWIFFTLGVFSVFILRKKYSEKERPYKVPLYPIVPIVGGLGGVYILVATIKSNPFNSFIGIAITLSGLVVYYFINNKN
ncbi:APC family permease [Hathewaya histolytica]|uniref:APC family permease n=1 Tax=Hathewaya histolytica TaxID=1498 RepID=UPI003B6753B9